MTAILQSVISWIYLILSKIKSQHPPTQPVPVVTTPVTVTTTSPTTPEPVTIEVTVNENKEEATDGNSESK